MPLARRFLTAAALSAVGLVVLTRYEPTSVSEPFGPWHLAGLFVVFLFWFAAVIGWGRMAAIAVGLTGSRRLSKAEEWSVALGLGSLVAAAWAYLSVLLGPHRGVALSSVVFLVAGAFALALPRRHQSTRALTRDKRHLLLYSLLATYVVLRFIQSTRLARHGDPLYYHLVAPVLWVRSNLSFDPAHPLNFCASAWEGLFLWPAQWFLGTGDVGLPAIQIFSQWIHLSIGWVGMAVAVVALLRRLRVPLVPALIGGFAALATRSLWWTGALAKNDCGVAFWLLSGVVLLWTMEEAGLRLSFAAGALLGASVATKYSAVFLGLPLLVVWAVDRVRRQPKRLSAVLAAFLVGGLVSAAPFLMRNWIGGGSPLFPISLGGPDGLARVSQTSREYYAGIAPSGLDTGLSWRLGRLGELSEEGPLALLSLLALVLLIWPGFIRRARLVNWRGATMIFLGPLASLAFFLLIGKAGTDFRLLGPGLTLLNVSGTLVTLLLLRNIARSSRRLRFLPAGWVTLSVVALTCRLAPEAVVDRIRDFPIQQEIEGHTGGDTKAWIARNVPKSERIVTSGDNEIYYLLGHDVTVGTDDLRLDRLWRKAVSTGATPDGLLVRFRGEGFRYLLDTRFPGEPDALAVILRQTLDRHSEWVVFQGRESRLIDLDRVGGNPGRVAGPGGRWNGESVDQGSTTTLSLIPAWPAPQK